MEAEDAAPLQWMLLSQNIGAIECNTEEMTVTNMELTANWLRAVKEHILAEESRVAAPIDIVVLHLQEVGGKKYNRAFLNHLSSVIQQCTPYAGSWCSGLIMPDENDGITFTAMATCFFVAPRVADVCSILSFRHRTFIALSDGPVQWVGNRRALFHGAKFSGAGSSRKGFLLTSLRVGFQIFNFVNVHLFHDADNSVAAAESPSEYALKRVDALVEMAAEIAPVTKVEDPLFVFGDFNFRLDVGRVVRAFQQQFGQPITLKKKEITAPDAAWKYLQDPANWEEVRTFDTEGPAVLRALRERSGLHLAEPIRNFGPTYLLETEAATIKQNATNDSGYVFQRDRLPAWCDRVWLNTAAAARSDRAAYWTPDLGPMDHKPVQLRFTTLL